MYLKCVIVVFSLSALSNQCTEKPLPCSFESEDDKLCQWQQDRDDVFDWTRHSGRTSSANTGPQYGDQTFQSPAGHYLYIEVSSKENWSNARIISPVIYPFNSSCAMTFYYNMFGPGIGSLRVYKVTPGDENETKVFERSGTQGTDWHKTTITFETTKKFQVIIEGMRGTTYTGDIAIDETSFSNSCEIIDHGCLRIVPPSGIDANQGRLDIYLNGIWGSICDRNFDTATDGVVACMQLGYFKANTSTYAVSDSNPPILDSVQCYGNETMLLDCGYNSSENIDASCNGNSVVNIWCHDRPSTGARTTLSQTTVAPTTAAKTTVERTTNAPTTDALTTTQEQTTVSPTTTTPTNDQPIFISTGETTEAQAPTSVAQTTLSQVTDAPTTLAKAAVERTTNAPTTDALTTTQEQTTESPINITPTNDRPNVNSTGEAPTTVVQTILPQASDAPTTVATTAVERTTNTPTTDALTTTQKQTTLSPTTITPTNDRPIFISTGETTEALTSVALATQSQATDAPTTIQEPTIVSATTMTPANNRPNLKSTGATTEAPTAVARTTLSLATDAPTTVAEAVLGRTANAPTTDEQTTTQKPTVSPTSIAPTNDRPNLSFTDDIGICATPYCENGGLCIELDHSKVTEFKCACTPGFRGSTCTGVVVTCGLNEFNCVSGECIPLKKQCDNIPYDCADNSDELNGDCNTYDCKYLLAELDSLMNTCGNISRLNSTALENKQNVWQFLPDSIDFHNYTTIISKIIVDVAPYMGTDITSDGTLFVALLSENENNTPVFYFKLSYQNGDGNSRFVKILTDIYTMGMNHQLLSLSFLPDGLTKQIQLSYSKCNQGGACLTLETTNLITTCDKECIIKYADWRHRSDPDRNVNCEVTYIDSVIDPLYEQCLNQPFITMISANTEVNINEKQEVSLYCVARGTPTPTVQWVNRTEPDEFNYIGERTYSQVIYQITDISSTTRFACHAVNVLDKITSKDVVISLEDPLCTDFHKSSKAFSVSNSVCYNETVEKFSLSNKTSDGLTYTGYLYGKTVLSSASLSSYSFSSSSKEKIRSTVLAIEIVIWNVMSGAVIYRQVFDRIINSHNSTSIHFSFDQPIKINSTSRYEFTLSITEPTYQLNSDQLEVKGVTCYTGSQECRQFIKDWNEMISAQMYAVCDDTDAQYRAAELCFGEFFDDPEVIRHPESQINKFGLTTILECNIRNIEFYNWYKNGKRLSSSGPTYTLRLEDAQDQGDYVCLGFRSKDSKNVTSNIATVLITGVSTFRVRVKFQILYKEDYSDKESEEFKNFTRNLATALEGELHIPFRIFVASIESGSVITEMELYFTDQLQNASVIRVMINDSLLSLPDYETDPSSIFVMSISICLREDVIQDEILYSFPDALLGTTAESTQTCPLVSNEGTTVSLATRYCGGDFASGASWSHIVLLDCGLGNTSRQIQNINEVEVTEDNGAVVADALAVTTNNTTSLDEDSIIIVSDILEDIVELEIADESVTLDVVEIVDNVIESIELGTDFSARETASSFVASLERQLGTVAAAGMNFTSVLPRVSVMTLSVSSDALENGLAYVDFGDSNSVKEHFDPKSIRTFFELTFPIDMVAASISLPPDIISESQHQTGEDDIRVYFTVYQNNSLFISNKQANESEKDFQRQVGSYVISASIEAVKIGGLVNPIKVAFLPLLENIIKTECVFWDFSLDNGLGDWSNESCTYNGTVDDRAICLCEHLTNFAILVDYYEPKDETFLTIISLIGCIVSVVCLAITIVTYLYFKQFRTNRPKKILINLSISLFCLYLVFAIGIERKTSKNSCIAVGALIHYFALASVFWMSVEAINMYLMFVKVFYDGIRYFMLKMCVLGYGAPLVIVAICLGINIENYANENYCFIGSGHVRNFGLISVIGVLLLFNFFVFAVVMRNITCGRKAIKPGEKELFIKRLQNAFTVSVLLGLTWVFGFLAIGSGSSVRDLFQGLFCFFNSLQGLFIFVLFCVRQKDVRDAWKGCCKRGDEASRLKYSTYTSSKGKVKEHSIPLTDVSTQSTILSNRANSQI